MPTSDDPDVLIDTSLSVPILSADHPDHRRVVDAVRGRSLALAGHAEFETFSVLTRLPPNQRLRPSDAVRSMRSRFRTTRHLTTAATPDLLGEIAGHSISGGAVYDALVGAAAREHDVLLLTRDARAAGTYRALGVDFELIR